LALGWSELVQSCGSRAPWAGAGPVSGTAVAGRDTGSAVRETAPGSSPGALPCRASFVLIRWASVRHQLREPGVSGPGYGGYVIASSRRLQTRSCTRRGPSVSGKARSVSGGWMYSSPHRTRSRGISGLRGRPPRTRWSIHGARPVSLVSGIGATLALLQSGLQWLAERTHSSRSLVFDDPPWFPPSHPRHLERPGRITAWMSQADHVRVGARFRARVGLRAPWARCARGFEVLTEVRRTIGLGAISSASGSCRCSRMP
jgi:hypothetical protein